ncbi:hypothetical protein Bca4012_051070 [Brassica carinata]|uniref:Uncharacterized protein n=1 Tax=Brassica carinata TaxID=52824 RepID=A0A8X7UKX5_BRACI|nr:hypothetical protein Bca52824_053747 [Brassica carinata]
MSDSAGASPSVLPAIGEVPVEAPTSEALPVCDTVPAGEAVAKNVLAPAAEVQPSGSSMTPVRVVDASSSQEIDRRRTLCSKCYSGCRAQKLQEAEC